MLGPARASCTIGSPAASGEEARVQALLAQGTRITQSNTFRTCPPGFSADCNRKWGEDAALSALLDLRDRPQKLASMAGLRAPNAAGASPHPPCNSGEQETQELKQNTQRSWPQRPIQRDTEIGVDRRIPPQALQGRWPPSSAGAGHKERAPPPQPPAVRDNELPPENKGGRGEAPRRKSHSQPHPIFPGAP